VPTNAASKAEARTPGPSPAPAPDPFDFRSAADLLKIGGDATRLRILALVRDEPRNVTAICEAVGASHPAVSHMLAILRHCRLVAVEREGKRCYYTCTDAGRAVIDAARAMVGK
jgi:DNA-binding transcriptional ArsR family regulator